jgi:putative oxidoreductase
MKETSLTRSTVANGILVGVRLGLGLALLLASMVKLRQPFDFLDTVYAYKLVGPGMGLIVAITLPIAELITAVCLLGGLILDGALAVSLLLSCMFVIAQASALHRGLGIACGCFGAGSESHVSYGTLVRLHPQLACIRSLIPIRARVPSTRK